MYFEAPATSAASTVITEDGWSSVDIEYAGTTEDYVVPIVSEVMMGYLDYVAVTALGGEAPKEDAGGGVVYVKHIKGTRIPSDQRSGAALHEAEGGDVSKSADSMKFSTNGDGAAQYEIYFESPTYLAETFHVSVAAQLGPDDPDAAGTHWKIDMYDFGVTDRWKVVGDLTGVTASSWGTVDLALTVPKAAHFVDPKDGQILVMYIDHIEVSCEGDQQNAPTGAPSSDSSSETDAPTESVVMFVKKIKGKKLKKDQDDGTELAASEGTTDPSTSVKFASVDGAAEAPPTSVGDGA
eukprot:jgi/Undpi1/7632/HiC_scaffold_23.g10105.m1